MYCPKCGQERASTDTSFCSRCGYLLTGTADLMLTGGLIPQTSTAPPLKRQSPRSLGIKQGVFLLLTSVVIVPLLTLFAIMVNMRSPVLPIASLIILVGGALLRIAYAVMFESPEPSAKAVTVMRPPDVLPEAERVSLPEGEPMPARSYAAPATGGWRDTNDLEPTSVTEGTTKLFEKN